MTRDDHTVHASCWCCDKQSPRTGSAFCQSCWDRMLGARTGRCLICDVTFTDKRMVRQGRFCTGHHKTVRRRLYYERILADPALLERHRTWARDGMRRARQPQEEAQA